MNNNTIAVPNPPLFAGDKNPRIANASVTTDKIADANVTTEKINDGAVIEAKIADGAVINSKVAAEMFVLAWS